MLEIINMGRTVVSAKMENLADLYAAESKYIKPKQVRSVSVREALVDTGATFLSLPKRLITKLGLKHVRIRRARTAAGIGEMNVYSAVRLTVQGRDCIADVAEVSNECPPIIGQVPLEILDFVVDRVGQRLIGNPAHGGEQMIELYSILPIE